MSDRITIRLGPLAEPLREAAEKSGRSMADEARRRLARSLRVAAPEAKQGFAASGKAAEAQKRAVKARKKRRKK